MTVVKSKNPSCVLARERHTGQPRPMISALPNQVEEGLLRFENACHFVSQIDENKDTGTEKVKTMRSIGGSGLACEMEKKKDEAMKKTRGHERRNDERSTTSRKSEAGPLVQQI